MAGLRVIWCHCALWLPCTYAGCSACARFGRWGAGTYCLCCHQLHVPASTDHDEWASDSRFHSSLVPPHVVPNGNPL